MPRPVLHPEETILDATRAVVLDRGPRGATVAAISARSGAPVGSIYHRFGSLEDLLAAAWMRAAGRAQRAALAASGGALPQPEDPADAAVTVALALYDFCIGSPEDALLLSRFQLGDFDRTALSPAVRRALEHVNDEIDPLLRRLARRIGGRHALDAVRLALVDLPFGAALRHIQARTAPPAARRARLERAIRAAVAPAAPAPAAPAPAATRTAAPPARSRPRRVQVARRGR